MWEESDAEWRELVTFPYIMCCSLQSTTAFGGPGLYFVSVVEGMRRLFLMALCVFGTSFAADGMIPLDLSSNLSLESNHFIEHIVQGLWRSSSLTL